jgi:hypothetical protein
MGDDLSHRSYRSHETIARTGQPRAAAPASDPLAELARLIGQTNPFAEAEQRLAEQRLAEQARTPAAPAVAPPPEWTRPQSEAAPAPVAAYQTAPQQQAALYEVDPVPAYLTARGNVQHTVYDAPEAGFTAGEGDIYDDLPPPRRRMGLVVGLVALVLAGGAVAYGYHAVFGPRGSSPPPVIHADNTPSKIVPAGQNKDSSKLITERVGDAGEKIVARDEKPVDISDKIAASSPNFPPAAPAPAAAAPQASAVNGVIGSEPRKVHTIVIRADGEQAGPAAPPAAAAPAAPPLAPAKTAAATPESPFPPAPPPPPARTAQAKPPAPEARPVQPAHTARAHTNAPLSLSPNAPAPAKPETRVASAGPTSLAPVSAPAVAKGAYAVQVSSQRSEQEAQAAFHALQGKYPSQLGGKPMFVHKVELGAKGTYYRALVGPFASSSEAVSLCTSLKSAGGSCFIQRN